MGAYGAKASANLYSLIETAKANGWEPFVYLTKVFEGLATAQTVDEFDLLLPWNLKSAAEPAG
ncbi:transposase IS66 [Magnetococcus marinus MC-1]|uniref:Transposase IS66 n=1 Tax=Magnetococcus marinus (strain ATCC BAA-1437 / JCM 17883 / MC-1) TaxID=156889 RepID=A0L5D5_MAGMM|nr:IS66 family transposase [Magnetococcus marinus]ABK43178.1 transposase IS66 [Magnetococcus marinus MC-1]